MEGMAKGQGDKNGVWGTVEGYRCCMHGVWGDIDSIWAREGELVF